MASAAQIVGLLAGVAGGFVVGLFGFRATQSAPPPPTKAIVSKEVKYSVRTEPFGATISIDNQVVGTAPMVLTFSTTQEKSSYSLNFSHPGYASRQLELRPEKDEEATITLEAQ
jgi:hypothetical protein